MTLAQATNEVLSIYGPSILRNPSRFKTEIINRLGSNSPANTILDRYCNERFLSPYAEAEHDSTADSLINAYIDGIKYLWGTGSMSVSQAKEISLEISRGLADYCNILIDLYSIPLPPLPPNGDTEELPPPPPPPPPPSWPFVVGALVIAFAVVGFYLATKLYPPAGSVTIAFDSNGASSGSVDPVTCKSHESFELPSGSNLTRDGFNFIGWSEDQGGGQVHEPGDMFSANKNVTLYAHWVRKAAVEPNVVSSDRYTLKDGSVTVILTIQNRGHEAVDMQAEFTFSDSTGKTVDTKSDQAISVGPGETTVLKGGSSITNVKDVSYKVTSTEPKYGDQSILSCISVEEMSNNDSGLTLRVTNTSQKDIVLLYGTAYGKKNSEEFVFLPIQLGNDECQISPGKSRILVFDGDQWQSLDYDVYYFGYVK